MNRPPLKLIAAFAAGALLAGALVWLLPRGEHTAAPSDTGQERKVLYWTDPMVPGFRSDKPGKSPFMDMELVPVYEDEAGDVVRIRPEIAQSLGVRTHEVTRGAPMRRIVTTGVLLRDAKGMAALVDLFDREAGAVRAGQKAEVRVHDTPSVYAGTVERIERDLDSGARALKARIRLAPAEPAPRADALAEVTILASGGGRPGLYVPREALIRTGMRTAVVLALGEGRFQPVEVVPGVESDDWVEIQRGIKAGDRVVTSGQFLIDSEANVRASLKRMETETPNGAPPAAPHTNH